MGLLQRHVVLKLAHRFGVYSTTPNTANTYCTSRTQEYIRGYNLFKWTGQQVGTDVATWLDHMMKANGRMDWWNRPRLRRILCWTVDTVVPAPICTASRKRQRQSPSRNRHPPEEYGPVQHARAHTTHSCANTLHDAQCKHADALHDGRTRPHAFTVQHVRCVPACHTLHPVA